MGQRRYYQSLCQSCCQNGRMFPSCAAKIASSVDAALMAFQLSIMLTIFALQDSFGTACNVTGDGALTLILTGYAKRHHIEEQNISVDL